MMFEDNPPPLPSTAPDSSKLADNILADLDDNNRLTAVADDDSFTLDDGDHSHPPSSHETFDILSNIPAIRSSSKESLHASLYMMSSEIDEKPQSLLHLPEELVNGSSVPSTSAWDITWNELNLSDQHEITSADKLPIESAEFSSNEEAGKISTDQESVTASKDTSAVFDKSELASEENSLEADANDFVNLKLSVKGENNEVIKTEVTATGSENSITHVEGHGVTNEITELGSLEDKSVVFTDQIDDDGFDEFGDFAESSVVEDLKACYSDRNENEDNKHTEFEQAYSSPMEQETRDAASDDWVADFQNAYSFNASSFSALESNQEGLPVISEFFDDVFWRNENMFHSFSSDVSVSHATDLVEQMNTVVSRKDSLNRFETVWLAVSIVEEALALKFQWASSSTYKNFLDSLNVDLKSATIEKNPNLPAFARQLSESTILQPISTLESEKKKWDVSNSGARSPTPDTMKPSHKVPLDSLAVPPVQFDWNNSGLTNPLASGSISASSALLDLECLTTNDPGLAAGKSGAKDVSITLQKDLAALGLNVDASPHQDKSDGVQSSGKKPSLFDQIMKKEANERRYVSTNELSLDARALHDQLPDLDYMLSNVLLFSMTDR